MLILVSIYTREIPAIGGISLALRVSDALGATFGCLRRPCWGAYGAYFGNRRRRRRFPKWVPEAPKGGARGATPPEGEGNPAEGGYFASIYINSVAYIMA